MRAFKRFIHSCLVASVAMHCSTDRRRVPVDAGIAGAPSIAGTAHNRPVEDGDFEPEEGAFGLAAPDPYEIRLRELLFAEDSYRTCQLVIMPSFEPESAVYITAPEQGAPVVVSRKLNVQLFGLMMTQIRILAGGAGVGKPIRTDLAAQTAALARIPVSTDTNRAEIDPVTVGVLHRACESVLKRTHHHGATSGVDGVGYHAGHWKPGVFLSGRAHSPAQGTISSSYIALGETLASYAASAPSKRAAIKADLVAKAQHLVSRSELKTR
jgi:hypothetical protein